MKSQSAVIRDIQQIDSDTADLLLLLALPPETILVLTTKLINHRVVPDIIVLQRNMEDVSPDVRAEHLLHAKRRSEL